MRPSGIKLSMNQTKASKLEVSQCVDVSVAHRYWNVEWPEAKNRQTYGVLASSEGVGSNLKLTAAVWLDQGDVELSDHLQFLKQLVDHRCLFEEFPEFFVQASTLERITVFLAKRLFERRLGHKSLKWAYLRVEEMDGFGCQVEPESDVLKFFVRAQNLTCIVQRPLSDLAAHSNAGIGLPRLLVNEAVRDLAPDIGKPREQWAAHLFEALASRIEGLKEVRVDLGCQPHLCIKKA